MIREKIYSSLLSLFLWGPIVFFSSLLIHNSLLYYTFDNEYGILPEKAQAMKDPVWVFSLYVHIISGVLCLSIPVFSFLGKYIGLGIRAHRAIGKLYVLLSLFIVAPTGMYLALYAKGGFIAQAGFMAQGILLSFFTYRGYKTILQGNKTAHIQWMIRSYAMASAVLSFRIFHIAFFFTTIPYEDLYGLSQWLSVVVNALIAETIIAYRFPTTKIIHS